jgi:cutinase
MMRIVGTLTAAAWTLPITPIQLPTATADPCPDVEVVFARGTTEPPGVGGVGVAYAETGMVDQAATFAAGRV